MTVQVEFQLPAQATVGKTRLQPLGGDGFVSPMSQYQINAFSDGDGTGGVNRIYCRMDPRYVQLVTTVVAELRDATGDQPVSFQLKDEYGIDFGVNAQLLDVDRPASSYAYRCTWSPQPLAIAAGAGDVTEAPFLVIAVPNITGTTLVLSATIYNFDRQAREKVPLELLYQTFTRSAAKA